MNNCFKVILFCLGFGVFACNESLEDYAIIFESEVIPFVPSKVCNESLYPLPPVTTYCPDTSEEDCNIIDKDTLYNLSAELLDQFPNFCMNAPERLYFRDTSGNYQAFEVIEKEWFSSKVINDDECTRGFSFCYLVETAFIRLKSINQPHHFMIRFSTAESPYSGNELDVGTRLDVLDFSSDNLVMGEIRLFIATFLEPFFINPKTNFFLDFNINGTNYSSVLEGPLWPASNTIKKIYYSLELGIVGFLDDRDELWNLVS